MFKDVNCSRENKHVISKNIKNFEEEVTNIKYEKLGTGFLLTSTASA